MFVAPNLPVYSDAFKTRMTEELGNLRPHDCPRTGRISDTCSALAVYAADHLHLRDQIRAAQ